jgi:hypothetical protein
LLSLSRPATIPSSRILNQTMDSLQACDLQ